MEQIKFIRCFKKQWEQPPYQSSNIAEQIQSSPCRGKTALACRYQSAASFFVAVYQYFGQYPLKIPMNEKSSCIFIPIDV